MKVSVQVIVHPDDAETSAVVCEVFALNRDGLALDTLGLQLAEAKDLLVAAARPRRTAPPGPTAGPLGSTAATPTPPPSARGVMAGLR